MRSSYIFHINETEMKKKKVKAFVFTEEDNI